MARRKKVKVGNPEPLTLSVIIASVITAISGMIVNAILIPVVWIYGIGRKVITGALALLAMTAFHAMVNFAPDQAIRMMRTVTEVFRTPPAEWAGFIAEYLEMMTGETISLEEITGAPGIMGGKATIEKLGEKFLHPMLNLIMPGVRGPTRELRIQPEDGIDAAERFLGTNLQFQMGAWLLHLYGDLMSFGMWKSLKDLPNAISWSYGIGWLSWLVMGVPFRIGISDPLEEFYNELYRPADFSLARLADAMNMGLVPQSYAVDRLRKMGWPEDLIPIVLDMERTKLTKAEAKTLFRHNFLTPEQYVETYRRRGYTPEEAKALANIEAGGSPQDIIEKMADEAFDLYVDNLMDEATVRQYLAAALDTPEEIELKLALAELKRIKPPPRARVEKKLSAANVGNLLKRGKRSRHEAIVMFLDAGVMDYQIDDWLALYEPEKPPEPTEGEIATETVGGLYKRGEIDADEASLLWSRLEWPQEKIMYLLRYYRRG